MTKQEQIMEMVVEINNAVEDNIELVERKYLTLEAEFRTHGMGINFNAVGFAEALYNAGYRKVLLETENGYAVDCPQYAPWELIKGYTEREVEKARKETAREILQTLYDQCYEYNPRLPEESIGHIIPINILTLAKQYGVEVEE